MPRNRLNFVGERVFLRVSASLPVDAKAGGVYDRSAYPSKFGVFPAVVSMLRRLLKPIAELPQSAHRYMGDVLYGQRRRVTAKI